MARVLLVNPPKKVPVLDWVMRYPPLGLMSLAASLGDQPVEILDMKAEKAPGKKLVEGLSRADVTGITVLTPSIDSVLDICRLARKARVPTVLGGVHPSLVPQVIEDPSVDIVVRGEGELTFREITDGRPLSEILGISYKNRGGVAHNADRPEADIAALPPPRRDLTGGGKRYRAFGKSLEAVSTARGCPYRCSFCCVPRLWRGYRELSPEAVVRQLGGLEHTEIVSIVDDNFCHDMERVEAICDLIVEAGLNDRLYSVFSRVDSIVRHPEVVEKMARANMRVVFIGIEAATQSSLDRMKKNLSLGDIHRACEILEANGMFTYSGQIIGNLDDTYDDVEALIALSNRLPVDLAQYTVITPYPGTELYRRASEENLIDDYDFSRYCECEAHMHTQHLSRMEITELVIKAYLEFYSLGASLARWRRWKRNSEKRWLVRQDSRGLRAFFRFQDRSAFYFWNTYRKMVGKTQGTKVRRFSPLFSTPVLFAVGAAIASALVTYLVTSWAEGLYGAYSAMPAAFVSADLLFSSAFAAFVTALVVTPVAVRSYRRGWIFSTRRRKPAKRERTLWDYSVRNAVVLSAIALAAATVVLLMIAALLTGGVAYAGVYGVKEALVSAIAFFTSGVAAYCSIRAVRNGSISPPG